MLAWQQYWTFPWTANHAYLGFVIVAVFAVLDPERDDEEELAIYSLRWMAAVLFFYAGLQKVMYGYYFHGEFLVWKVAHGFDSWRVLFGTLIPDAEISRLEGLDGGVGSGPYRVDSMLLVLVSNAVWVGECAIGVLLCIPRTRVLAAIAGIGLVFSIQAVPREFMFALLYSYMLLLWLPGNVNRRLLPLYAFAVLYLLAVLAGVAPGRWLLMPGGRI